MIPVYKVRLLDPATRELARLDKHQGRRVVARIYWLAENLEHTKREVLVGDFEGLFKLRVGDYRVIYEVIPQEQIILVHLIGHRGEIYRKR